MQRPPGSKGPQVLLTRPTYEWINRVNQKHKQLKALQLSPEQSEGLKHWVETEFVYSALKLEGVDTSHSSVVRLITSAPSESLSDDDRLIARHIEALRAVESLAEKHGREAELTPELLLGLQTLLEGAPAAYRKLPGGEPHSAEAILARVEVACRWFAAESFTELNPVEQASIVYLRIIEIQPFDRFNERAALFAASLMTLRSELPPIIIRPERQSAYRGAVEEGLRMNTKPMVELFGEVIEGTLGGMIETVEGKS